MGRLLHGGYGEGVPVGIIVVAEHIDIYVSPRIHHNIVILRHWRMIDVHARRGSIGYIWMTRRVADGPGLVHQGIRIVCRDGVAAIEFRYIAGLKDSVPDFVIPVGVDQWIVDVRAGVQDDVPAIFHAEVISDFVSHARCIRSRFL